MNKELIQKIRDARFKKGYLIGGLINAFGAEAVYAAFDLPENIDERSAISLIRAIKSDEYLTKLD